MAVVAPKPRVSKGCAHPLAGFLGTESLSRRSQAAKLLLGAAAPPEKRSEKVNFVAASHKRGNPCKGGIS